MILNTLNGFNLLMIQFTILNLILSEMYNSTVPIYIEKMFQHTHSRRLSRVGNMLVALEEESSKHELFPWEGANLFQVDFEVDDPSP